MAIIVRNLRYRLSSFLPEKNANRMRRNVGGEGEGSGEITDEFETDFLRCHLFFPILIEAQKNPPIRLFSLSEMKS